MCVFHTCLVPNLWSDLRIFRHTIHKHGIHTYLHVLPKHSINSNIHTKLDWYKIGLVCPKKKSHVESQ
jgi:hypothetical protein